MTAADESANTEILIVGAGLTGLFALHHFRSRGWDPIVVEAGSDVGGTWHWNRYPGARVDIESIEYSYAFSDDLQQKWVWTERYAAQPELERYFRFVADHFDLRRSIRFNTRVASAAFDERSNFWTVRTEAGDSIRSRYLVMASGILSAPNEPTFEGMDSFKGRQLHSAHWPREKVDFSGQRVGIVGTGSSAVQMTPIIAQEAKELFVFQRTPNFSVPLRNEPLPSGFLDEVKANYAEWRRMEKFDSFGGWVCLNYRPASLCTDLALDQTPEARRAFYEERYRHGGLAFYNMYPDVFSDAEANETLAEFLREKIRERINDPAVAEKLVPKGYPVLTKRLCADTGYFEAFNRDNVKLVDVKSNPITCITPKGILVGSDEYPLDVIIYATGFDAMSGAVSRIDIRGAGGKRLKDHWAQDFRTAFGLMSAGFPNLFFMAGPGSPAPLFQPVLFCEDQGRWIADCIQWLKTSNHDAIEPSRELEAAWLDHCETALHSTLFPLTPSWYVSGNVEGKPRSGLIDFGGIGAYRASIADAASRKYADFVSRGSGIARSPNA